ncbi:MAG TPA: hypothetical protein VF281_03560 [Candidatus Saccharimonadales bacterium]
MSLEIVKSILVTGIDQEGRQIQVTAHDRKRQSDERILNVTVTDLTGNELRSQLNWQFAINENDPQNAEHLKNIQHDRREYIERNRENWKDEKDPKVLTLVEKHRYEPAIFCLKPIGTHPVALIVGMHAVVLDQSHNGAFIFDVLGEIVDLKLL